MNGTTQFLAPLILNPGRFHYGGESNNRYQRQETPYTNSNHIA
ncbi:hypothetical protein N9Z77_01805 [Akkermansiaceae bacterium]|nr:hypothetical protein [Akkermansiaceae bacterium]